MKKSPRRSRAIWGVLVLLFLGGGWLFWRAQSTTILARASNAFEQMGFQSPRFAEVSISPIDGLRFEGVEAELASVDPATTTGPRIGFDTATIALDWFALLGGVVRPTHVHIHDAFVQLTDPPAGDWSNWRLDQAQSVRHAQPLFSLTPTLRVDRLTVRAMLERGEETQLHRQWVFEINGSTATSDSGEALYRLTFHQIGGTAVSARSDAGTGPLATADWNGERLRLSTGWFDSDALTPLLPMELSSSLRDWAASGQIKLDEMIIDSRGARSAKVTFEHAWVALPLEGPQTPASRRFAQIRDAQGSIGLVFHDEDARGRPVDMTAEAHGEAPPGRFSLKLEANDVNAKNGLDPSAARGLLKLFAKVDGARFPTKAENPNVVESEALPEPIRSFLADYQPTGGYSLEIAVEREKVDKAPRFKGVMRPIAATCRYFRFPYDMRDVSGEVRFTDEGIWLEGLIARHGSAWIRADGKVNHSGAWAGFDLVFAARNVAMEADLYEALPTEYQQLWDDAWPIGLCDLTAFVQRGEGSREHGSKDPRIRVDARLLAGSLSAPALARLTHAAGEIRVEHGDLDIRQIVGLADADASMALRGEVTLPTETHAGGQDIAIRAADFPLDKTATIQDSSGGSLGNVVVSGIADLWGRVKRSVDLNDSEYVARLKRGAVRALDDARPWSGLSGWLTTRNGLINLHGVQANRGGAALQASGAVDEDGRTVRIDLAASDADLPGLLRSLIPGRWSNVRESLGLAGEGRVEGSLRSDNGAFGADIRVDAARMRPSAVPLDLRDVRATLAIRDDGFQLTEGQATCADGGEIRLHGGGAWGPPATCELRAELSALPLAPQVVDAMPPAVESLLKRLGARGVVNVRFDRVRLEDGMAAGSDWIGAIQFRNASMDIGLPLTGFDGEIGGRITIAANGDYAVETDFTIAKGELDGRPIADWSGRLLRTAGDPLLHVTDIAGDMCDGKVSGEATIEMEKSSYEISLALYDLDLSSFLQLKNVKPGEAGRADGRVFARGHSDTPGSRQGGGDLRVRGAKWLDSKVGSSLAQASRDRNQTVGDDIDSILLRFAWTGAEMRFNRVDIQSRDLRLIGSGSWNLNTDVIALTLLGASPRDAARLAVVSDLLELAGRELLQYRIEGLASAPRVTVEPLHNLTEPLRNLAREMSGESR